MTDQTTSGQHFHDVLQLVEGYYNSKLARHGTTPLGVDWSCAATQELRFVKLLNICDSRGSITLNDFGCGYGALLGFIQRAHNTQRINYLGLDLSSNMIAQARILWTSCGNARFLVGDDVDRVADYSVASGIFNVKLAITRSEWEKFIKHTLDKIWRSSRRGFAVNFLAILPHHAGTPPELYRTTAGLWSTYCRAQYQAEVEVLEHHAKREFTLLARY